MRSSNKGLHPAQAHVVHSQYSSSLKNTICNMQHATLEDALRIPAAFWTLTRATQVPALVGCFVKATAKQLKSLKSSRNTLEKHVNRSRCTKLSNTKPHWEQLDS